MAAGEHSAAALAAAGGRRPCRASRAFRPGRARDADGHADAGGHPSAKGGGYRPRARRGGGLRDRPAERDGGVYTISVFPDDPRHDATLHIDQYSGKVLADVRWQDYNAVARSVQMGVVLHEGKLFGLGNQLLMLAVCLAILLSSASGLWIWWKRKPAGRLGVPPLRHELPRWKTGIAIMLALGVAFLLVGASLLLVWALDWLVLSRLPAVRRVLA
ncbi:PepSY domain-containing protein [Pseudomonas aeruginosa]|nr:PepSY domain-containing protein [Pseudomonas aeruginosa]